MARSRNKVVSEEARINKASVWLGLEASKYVLMYKPMGRSPVILTVPPLVQQTLNGFQAVTRFEVTPAGILYFEGKVKVRGVEAEFAHRLRTDGEEITIVE